ncbi:MAG TPA: prepilin-type N-terminal cleavage/methylation domain-containing protein [Desulfomonilaceae bacterium]|nr:prepilin-type N-terminal cleavage/methylation domain-containing protein [Desulfomonilaceae bacterium]
MKTAPHIADATPANDGAFALVEVMVALLILAVGMLGAGLMLNAAMENDRYNNRVRFAQKAAQAKIEEIRSGGAAKYPNRSGSERLSGNGDWGSSVPSGWATREWSVSEDPVSHTEKIAVTVRWGKHEFTQVSYSK